MKTRLSLLAAFFTLVLFGNAAAQSQGESEEQNIIIDGSIHSPGEIFLLADRSVMSYIFAEVADSLDLITPPPLHYLGVNSYLSAGDDGTVHLRDYDLTDTIVTLVVATDTLFDQKHYLEAIAGYREVLKLYPEYHQMYTWIAQSFKRLDQTDSAIHYYQLAIHKNYIDYNAHWFLGDLYWDIADTVQALRHLTSAHILNRHHPEIKKALVSVRNWLGPPWQEWQFRPLSKMTKSENEITIETTINWMIYALTKALWTYEPGYSEQMSGPAPDSLLFDPNEEREAVAVWTMGKINVAEADSTELSEEVARIKRIIENGDLMPMIYYELAVFQWPKVALLMPRAQIDNMIRYVNTYH